MIRFFRTIRQGLLAESKFTRYLIYAVGEIVLVVIGIFIALQLNNWNADRKLGEQELKLLAEMRQNLERDLSDCRANIAWHKTWQRSQQIILTHLEERTPYHDSLQQHYGNLFGCTQLSANSSAYDNLKSIGFDLIRNDSLRRSITQLYGERYRFLSTIEVEFDVHFQLQDMGPQIYSKIVVDKVWKSGRPNDVNTLMDDHTFLGVLRMNLWTRQFMLGAYAQVDQRIVNLIEQIDQELASRAV